MRSQIWYIVEATVAEDDDFILSHVDFEDYDEALDLYQKLPTNEFVPHVQLVEEISNLDSTTRRLLEVKSDN